MGGKPKAGYIYHLLELEQEQGRCVFNEAQKQPQCTEAKTVVGSSLTPHAALLVHPSGTTYSTVDHHEFIENSACESRPSYL